MYRIRLPPQSSRMAGAQIDTLLKNFLPWFMQQDPDEAVEALYRSDWGRIVAALIRLVGDFEVAEEAAQEAFTAGVNQWRTAGVPEFPRAWIIQTARHKAIDLIRRRARFNEKVNLYAASQLSQIMPSQTIEEPDYDTTEI